MRPCSGFWKLVPVRGGWCSQSSGWGTRSSAADFLLDVDKVPNSIVEETETACLLLRHTRRSLGALDPGLPGYQLTEAAWRSLLLPPHHEARARLSSGVGDLDPSALVRPVLRRVSISCKAWLDQLTGSQIFLEQTHVSLLVSLRP